MKKFPRLFRRLGKLKDYTVKLHVDESVRPKFRNIVAVASIATTPVEASYLQVYLKDFYGSQTLG